MEDQKEKIRALFRVDERREEEAVAKVLGLALLDSLRPVKMRTTPVVNRGSVGILAVMSNSRSQKLRRKWLDDALGWTQFKCCECLKELPISEGILSGEDDYKTPDNSHEPTFYCLECFDKAHTKDNCACLEDFGL